MVKSKKVWQTFLGAGGGGFSTIQGRVRPVGDSKMHPEPPSQIGNLIRFGDFTVYECAAEQHCPAPDAKNVATLDGSRCMNVRRNKTEPHFVQSTKLRKATPPRTPRSMLLDFWRPGVRSGFRHFRRTRRGSPFCSDSSKENSWNIERGVRGERGFPACVDCTV